MIAPLGGGSLVRPVSDSPTTESSAVEDYLEIIHGLIGSKGYARVADVADGLGISQASVSNMMRRLDDKGLIRYEKYRGMTLTADGESVARRITKRHGILAELLDLFGVEEGVAYRDVEGMEHHVSPQTLRGLQQIVSELKENPEMCARVKKAAAEK